MMSRTLSRLVTGAAIRSTDRRGRGSSGRGRPPGPGRSRPRLAPVRSRCRVRSPPERFRRPPCAPKIPEAAWINRPRRRRWPPKRSEQPVSHFVDRFRILGSRHPPLSLDSVGTMIAASCNCGYENNALAVGGGTLSFMEHCAAPALCTTCREVVTIDLMDSDATCPSCGGAPTPYGDSSLGAAKTVHDGPAIKWNLPDASSFELDHEGVYTCPRCLQASMSFADVGCFD